MIRKHFLPIVGLWLAWLVILVAFQELVPARLGLATPDYALAWTPAETTPHSQDDKAFLVEPFLNTHVAWDSEFYLAIATGGYDDPRVRIIGGPGGPSWVPRLPQPLSLSYAFMPFYPIVMRGAALPLSLLGLNAIATASLAGVLVAALGTLVAMLALYDMARDELGDAGGLRAALYLVLFPTGFFLAQIYTEGLFVGLAFGSIALLRRKHWLWAVALAVAATWTRAVGLALIIPLAWAWWTEFRAQRGVLRPIPWALAVKALLVVLPGIAYLLWHYSFWGQAYSTVEQVYFGRGLFVVAQSWEAWTGAWSTLVGHNTQATVYYGLELAATLLGLVATAFTLRRYPDIALFGLAVLVVSLTSGAPQGMLRYVLAMPALFLFLSRLGQNTVFDRAWSLGSTLLMSVMAILYTFNMWAG